MARRARRFVAVRRNRFDADAGILADASSIPPFSISLLRKSISFALRRAGLPLDARIHVFGILTENHHVHFFGMRTGEGTPAKYRTGRQQA